jgi:hypothetical protein
MYCNSLPSASSTLFVIKHFDMEEYSCSDVPDKLYRVDYPGSRTTYSIQKGFKAGDTTKSFGADEMNDFKRAIEKQFTWSCRDPVPFISLFSDRRHAENWGRKEPWRGNHGLEGVWALYVIDTTELKKTTFFFKLSNLIEKLNLDIPKGAQQHIEGAFVCLHRIPPTAIVEKRTSAQVEEGKF